MRAVRSTDEGIRVLDVPDPVPADGLVEVRVAATAICGSDLHLTAMGALPVTLGHEFSGLLDDGTAVAVRPQVPCGSCDLCTAGRGQLCRTAGERLYGVSLDGGMAERVLVDPGTLFPLPEGVAVSDGCLVEPVAVALHGVNRASVQPGMRVLVVGGGPIGLCAVAAARAAGATVDLKESRAYRQEAGEAVGARLGADGEYDVVVEAAGTQSAFDLAVDMLRPQGVLCALGTYWAPVSMTFMLQMKEITLVPAFMYGHHHGEAEFAQAARILAQNPELPGALVTHRLPLADAARAFAVAADRDSGAIKVVMEP